jgi:hypothetical protein
LINDSSGGLMAYFIDPELDALTTGRSRPVAESPVAVQEAGGRRANKFGKKCEGCGGWVNAGAGYLGQKHGGWVVYCSTCP